MHAWDVICICRAGGLVCRVCVLSTQAADFQARPAVAVFQLMVGVAVQEQLHHRPLRDVMDGHDREAALCSDHLLLICIVLFSPNKALP